MAGMSALRPILALESIPQPIVLSCMTAVNPTPTPTLTRARTPTRTPTPTRKAFELEVELEFELDSLAVQDRQHLPAEIRQIFRNLRRHEIAIHHRRLVHPRGSGVLHVVLDRG